MEVASPKSVGSADKLEIQERVDTVVQVLRPNIAELLLALGRPFFLFYSDFQLTE